MKKTIQGLQSRRFALTTLAETDVLYADRLQTASVRGEHELLYWGVGPKLAPGDLVGLYTPNSPYLPPSDRSVLKRIYVVAAVTSPGSHWNHDMFLYRRVTIEPPLRFQELQRTTKLTSREIQRFGTMSEPWSTARVEALWQLAFEGRPYLKRLSARLLGNEAEEVAISYAGEDWVQAHRLLLWCQDFNLHSFFVTSTGPVLSGEPKPLSKLLTQVFARTKVAVFIVPRPEMISKWVELELSSALRSKRPILFVRTDQKRPWPPATNSPRIHRFDVRRACEGEAIARLLKVLRRLPPTSGDRTHEANSSSL